MGKKISPHERSEIISEIISNFMEGRYDPQEMDTIRELFVSWFEENQDAEIKDEYLLKVLELDKQEPGDLMKSEKMLKEYKRRVNFEEKKVVVKKSLPLSRLMMRVAAVVLPVVILSGGFLYFNYNKTTLEGVELVAANSKIETVTLPDNSEVWINSGSNLKLSENKNKQRVAELTGEGFFKVAKSQGKPFIVKTGRVNIEVLGTQFNIDAYPDRGITVVTLIDGLVNISSETGGHWNLVAAERLIYDNLKNEGEVIKISEKELAGVSGWRDGKLIFNNITPLEMLRMVERKFDVKIEIDPILYFSNEQIYVEFKPDDSLDFVMKYIKMFENNSFNYIVEGKRVKIIKPDI